MKGSYDVPAASGSGPPRPQVVPGTKIREGSDRAAAPDMASMTSLSSSPKGRDEKERKG